MCVRLCERKIYLGVVFRGKDVQSDERFLWQLLLSTISSFIFSPSIPLLFTLWKRSNRCYLFTTQSTAIINPYVPMIQLLICWEQFFFFSPVIFTYLACAFLLLFSPPLHWFSFSFPHSIPLSLSLWYSFVLAIFASKRIESIHLRTKSIMLGRESRLVIILYQCRSGECYFCYHNSAKYIIRAKRSLSYYSFLLFFFFS